MEGVVINPSAYQRDVFGCVTSPNSIAPTLTHHFCKKTPIF